MVLTVVHYVLQAEIKKLNFLHIMFFTYVDAVWAPYLTKTQWTKLESTQTKIVRLITGMSIFVRNTTLL